jgi:molecular chaperone GrpE
MEENKKHEEKNTEKETVQNHEHKKEDTSKKLELELAELKDKYLRALAELENTRRRTSLDIENSSRARAISVAEQFLPLVDAINAAFEHSPDDDGIKSLKKASDGTLGKLGIIQIETVGQQLNPMFHNVIMTEDSDKAENMITREMQSGFMFGDSVLRTAMVATSKGKKES